jgi:hypothetical protein
MAKRDESDVPNKVHFGVWNVENLKFYHLSAFPVYPGMQYSLSCSNTFFSLTLFHMRNLSTVYR